jgi:hypothetical protein
MVWKTLGGVERVRTRCPLRMEAGRYGSGHLGGVDNVSISIAHAGGLGDRTGPLSARRASKMRQRPEEAVGESPAVDYSPSACWYPMGADQRSDPHCIDGLCTLTDRNWTPRARGTDRSCLPLKARIYSSCVGLD